MSASPLKNGTVAGKAPATWTRPTSRHSTVSLEPC